MSLFPDEVAGLQRILITYIENECESLGFKVNDAHRDKWMKNDMERGLHRRHKERKFGLGCLEEWHRNVDRLTEQFYAVLQPFEEMLAQQPFLTGDRPVYADYALCGVIGNFLFSGATSLPAHYLMLEAWYTKMRAGNFRNPLDDLQHGRGECGRGRGIESAGRHRASREDHRRSQAASGQPGARRADGRRLHGGFPRREGLHGHGGRPAGLARGRGAGREPSPGDHFPGAHGGTAALRRRHVQPRHLPGGGASPQVAGEVRGRGDARAEDLRLSRGDRRHGAGRSRRGERVDEYARAAARSGARAVHHAATRGARGASSAG